MIINKSFFFKKKILIYGLGKSGISALKFLKSKKNKLYIIDVGMAKNINSTLKKEIVLQL